MFFKKVIWLPTIVLEQHPDPFPLRTAFKASCNKQSL